MSSTEAEDIGQEKALDAGDTFFKFGRGYVQSFEFAVERYRHEPS